MLLAKNYNIAFEFVKVIVWNINDVSGRGEKGIFVDVTFTSVLTM